MWGLKGADRLLISNYFVSLMRLYRAFWTVLLPYRVQIRPFAVCFSGKNYAENMINGNCAYCCCEKVCSRGVVSYFLAVNRVNGRHVCMYVSN